MAGHGVKKYEAGNVTWDCVSCGLENTHTIVSDIEFSQSMRDFKSLRFTCNHCGSFIFINMSLPESDYEELEHEVYEMPFYEINARKQIRDIMFAHRTDLKNLTESEKASRRNSKMENAPYWKDKFATIIQEEGTESP